MFLKFYDYLPEELNTKYFDFTFREYPDDKFCSDLLKKINLSSRNCDYYRNKLCKQFDYNIPDELSIDELDRIPYIPSNIYKKSSNNT